MQQHSNEIRLIWLMSLIIVAVSAWFLHTPSISAVCGFVFALSVMQYLDQAQDRVHHNAQQRQVKLQPTSKMPLYIGSILAVIGGSFEVTWLLGLGVTIWIFFFLRWLQRLERQISHLESITVTSIASPWPEAPAILPSQNPPNDSEAAPLGLSAAINQWIFQGNPVLKVAIGILVIGLILLLRFATEHWQLSLAVKLSLVALVSAVMTGGGYLLKYKNRSFSLALEGLGLAGLFLTLFFAYYNGIIGSLGAASVCFIAIIVLNLYLSLAQKSLELALMAMFIAYIAPFTLPVRDATALEFVAYYLAINIAVAVLTTLRPWKVLNQIAFLTTVIVAGGYAILHPRADTQHALSLLILAHSAVFIWVSFRFSQLLAKHDFSNFSVKPILDLALVFGAPLCGYGYLYLLHFDQSFMQALYSFGYAVVYAMLYLWVRRSDLHQLISQSYLSLTLIFMAFIPPTLLDGEWSVVGWAIEALVILMFALYRESSISRYLAMALFVVAGLSSFYYLFESLDFPTSMYWWLSLSYVLAVVIPNIKADFRDQLSVGNVVFFAFLMLCANVMLLVLLIDFFEPSNLRYALALLIVAAAYLCINELLSKFGATWTWLWSKWLGLLPSFGLAFILLIEYSQQGQIVWSSSSERLCIALTGVILSLVWLRPVAGIYSEKEWISFGALISLALTSLTLFPQMPYMSVVILPLVFCAWCYRQRKVVQWQMFWESRVALALVATWMISSQLFATEAFKFYLAPLINPFDIVSIGMLGCFIWMLSLQLQKGLERGLVAILTVMGILWLSSYIVLRALHLYQNTPFNEMAIWSDAVVQLSLTLLWVILALITMSLGHLKQWRLVWILGAGILVLVTLKLVLFDLSHIGTLTRVLSFLGAGSIMLLIAYIAPMPEEKHPS